MAELETDRRRGRDELGKVSRAEGACRIQAVEKKGGLQDDGAGQHGQHVVEGPLGVGSWRAGGDAAASTKWQRRLKGDEETVGGAD